MEVIKYDAIKSIGMELFRKNNSTFLKDPLSPIMSRIFKAANSPYVQNTDTDFYMKSGIIPNRVFYIYSNELTEKYPNKIADTVYFNNELCVWIYSKNAINKIDEDPLTIFDIYYDLLMAFMSQISLYSSSFNVKECYIAAIAMTANLMIFLNETYGALDIEQCKAILSKKLLFRENIDAPFIISNNEKFYEPESVIEFIEDVFEKCTEKSYFNNREYLDSYLLLKKAPKIIPV